MSNFVFNPDAPMYVPPDVDARSLFITFSNGFPLTESQIFGFFSRFYPGCVESVYVHRPTPQRGGFVKPSLFGKVTFRNATIPSVIMGQREKVFFTIGGMPIYCKKFVSQRSRHPEFAKNSVGPRHGGSRQE